MRASRFITTLLRHHPEIIELEIDKHGWADVKSLIDKLSQTQEFTMDMLEEIVRTDNKQRFCFNEDKTKIRANQGHSIQVDVQPTIAIPPSPLYHGTAEKSVESILKEGLKPMNRLHVHLSKDIKTATAVGSRHGKPRIFTINTASMIQDGYIFYLSANSVWLTDTVPPQYLQLMETQS